MLYEVITLPLGYTTFNWIIESGTCQSSDDVTIRYVGNIAFAGPVITSYSIHYTKLYEVLLVNGTYILVLVLFLNQTLIIL